MVQEPDCCPSSTDGPRRNPKSRNLFSRLRLRSRSVANLNRETSSPRYLSWFTRKPKSSDKREDCSAFSPLQDNGNPTSVAIGDYDRQISQSHSNLWAHSPEMSGENGFHPNASTSRMPSYVNISLMANGYSRSRTNLNSVLSRSGDVHNLIIDGADVIPANKDFKSVIFVNDSMKESPSPTPFSYLIPEFEVGTESIKIFESLLGSLEGILTQCVEMSETDLKKPEVSEEAKEALLVASGHTRVLLKSKIRKMKQLIDKSKENTGEVTLNDLGSFWTMMDIEVSKIREQFGLVEKYKENAWAKLPQQQVAESNGNTPRTAIKPKSKIAPKLETPRSTTSTPRTRPNVKDFLAARRRELAESQKTESVHNGKPALISLP